MQTAILAEAAASQDLPGGHKRATRVSGRRGAAVPRTLLPGASAGEAFQVIALSCLDRLRFNEERLARTGDPEALHQVRVALRQLRSAFSIFGRVLGDARFAQLRGELKWLSTALNDARDLDVLIARMGEPPAALVDARERAWARATRALASPRARRLRRELLARLAVSAPRIADRPDPADQPLTAFASASLERLHRKLGKRGRRFRALDDEELHELRITTKKLRYATEFFTGLFASDKARRREDRWLQALRALQDGLGQVQDKAVAPALLVRLLVPRADWPVLPPRKRLVERAADNYRLALAIKPFWR